MHSAFRYYFEHKFLGGVASVADLVDSKAPVEDTRCAQSQNCFGGGDLGGSFIFVLSQVDLRKKTKSGKSLGRVSEMGHGKKRPKPVSVDEGIVGHTSGGARALTKLSKCSRSGFFS